MKKRQQIRVGVFETNSSSTHSLTICTKEEYEKFKNSELFLNIWKHKLLRKDEVAEENIEDQEIFTYEKYQKYAKDWEDTFEEEYITPSGDKIVVFGYYDYDNC